MENKDIRRQNLGLLLDEAKTITALAEKACTAAAYLSQIINKAPNPSGNPREVGDTLARKLEKGMNRPLGWMDHQHNQLLNAPEHQNLNPRETALLGLFNGLTHSQQDDLLRNVEAQKQMNDALLGELLKRRG